MVEKVAAKTTTGSSTFVTALKLGVFLFALTRVAGFVFGAWWGLSALPFLRDMLQTAHLANLEATIDRVMGATLLPLNMAVLSVLTPLFGWWIYSRVPEAQQNGAGWYGALIFAACDASLTIVFSGLQAALGYQISLIGLGIGEAIVILWSMFFMGIGFNIAKLFKIKL